MDPMWLRRSRNGATIVFVHGILSGPVAAWTSANGTFWPRLLIEDERLDDFGVYLFAYRADALSGTYSLEDAVDVMRENFRLDGIENRGPNEQLIFVCHSMGGILARRFVVANQLDLAERRARLAFFLIASPSLGAEYANFAAAVAPLYNAQLEILRFSETNHWLNTLDRDFLNLKEGRRLLIAGKELVEDQFAAKHSLLRNNKVVPPWTGAKYFGNPVKIPRSDHITIAKPSKASDLQYRLLVDFIGSVCGEHALRKPDDGRTNSKNPLVVDWGKLLQEEDGRKTVALRKRVLRISAFAISAGAAALWLGVLFYGWLQPVIGIITIEFVNSTNQLVRISDQAEYYVTASESPGTNRRVDSGILRLIDPKYDSSRYTLNIPSGAKQITKARFLNEDKLVAYYKQGDKFISFVFSANPRPVWVEFSFDKRTFGSVLEIVIAENYSLAGLDKETRNQARVVVSVGPNLSNDVEKMISDRLGNAGIIISGVVALEERPNPTCAVVYYNEVDQQLSRAIKSDLDRQLACSINVVKETRVRAKIGVIDIVLDKVTLKN
ncbi:alpha/beta hydrolase [Bradyrhizobium sp. 200]|uniref:esterase/lipase family protein n=1 Tax=Bradyrhizobium sp. 200 TaxID=2782665 RepID=UPI001FFF7B7B|nr:alpha/beta hydrolase [Bradyrhizobium sp. 200]UPJ49153.1 alpha/beta hydrolase [Bradyrhizobium sp. 200]